MHNDDREQETVSPFTCNVTANNLHPVALGQATAFNSHLWLTNFWPIKRKSLPNELLNPDLYHDEEKPVFVFAQCTNFLDEPLRPSRKRSEFIQQLAITHQYIDEAVARNPKSAQLRTPE